MDEYSVNITFTIGITRSPDNYILIPCENQKENDNIYDVFISWTNAYYAEQVEDNNLLKCV